MEEDIPDDDFTLVQRKYPKGRRVRAGTIIINFTTRKLLIIQCYHKLWGLPKGHVEPGETPEECAVRETYEETGIRIQLSDLMNKYTIYNGDGIYYVVNGTHLNYNLSNIPVDQKEITGITWICIDCFEHMLGNGQITINSHLKHLLPYIYKEMGNSPPSRASLMGAYPVTTVTTVTTVNSCTHSTQQDKNHNGLTLNA